MPNNKDRKHSGRYTPNRAGTIPNSEKQDDLIQLPEESYDDWIERRDGMRYDPDKTHIRSPRMFCLSEGDIKKNNKKIKRKERIRNIRKNIRRKKND